MSSLLLATSSSLYAADSYEVIDLGVLTDGITPTVGYGLNDASVAVGYSTKKATTPVLDSDGEPDLDDNGDPKTEELFYTHAFSFDSNTLTHVDLGAIDDSENGTNIDVDGNYFNGSYALDINNKNFAVGFSYETFDTGVFERATIIDDSLNIFTIPHIVENEPKNMRALSINENDYVVGFGVYDPTEDATDTNYSRGFIFDSSTTSEVTRIDAVGDDVSLRTALRDINNNNIAVGWSDKIVSEVIVQGVFYVDVDNSMAITELDLFNEEGRAYAWAINDSNKIVGKSSNADNTLFTAFMFDIQTDELIDLGMLSSVDLCTSTNGRNCAEAFDINDPVDQNLQGEYQIVGTSLYSTFPETQHAFIYEKGEMKDLNNLIDCKVDPEEAAIGNPDWILHEARTINNQGDIVGNGLLNGVPKAFMLKLREGQAATLCEEITSDTGSGGLPVFLISLLGFIGYMKRKTL